MRNELEQEPLADSEGGAGFDLKEVVLYGLLRSRVLVVVCAAAGFGASLLWAASQPNTYRSDAKMLLRIGEREQVTAESIVNAPGARESRPTIEDELHLLRDERILRQVVEELGADYILEPADPARYDTPETALHVRWMHQLQSAMIALRSPRRAEGGGETPFEMAQAAVQALRLGTFLRAEWGSNVISVSHTSTSAEKAARITNALLDAYIRRHQEHFSVLRRLEPMRDKLDEARNAADAARVRFLSHVELCNLIDIDTQGPNLLNERDALLRDRFAAQTQLAENESRLAGLLEALGRTPARISVTIGSRNVPNPDFRAIEDMHSAAVARRAELDLERGLTNNERAQRQADLDQRIRDLRGQLDRIPREIPDPNGVTEERDNPLFPDLVRQISEIQVTDRGLRSRIENFDAQLEKINDQLNTLRECRDIHSRMDQDIRREQTTFEEMERAFSRLEALGRVDQQGDTNLSILQRGNTPIDKEGPSRGKLVLAGLVGGSGLGAFLALLRQFLDPRLRYPRGTARVLGVNLLSVVPELRSARQLHRGRHG